ncbi:hypothetical protein ANN_22653 [Periplaneta americana]|uniref:HTH CENPB-type domain-containing protein n=1 Tax=Periplaneta americana TaxID=6978 RepID=A0ABQ8S8Q1_PERAM|nr:hypothetical protein ANN_22653 [Periplaneta americana]
MLIQRRRITYLKRKKLNNSEYAMNDGNPHNDSSNEEYVDSTANNPHNDSSNEEYVDSTANVSSLNISLFDQGVFLIKQERLQQEKYKRQKFENVVKTKSSILKMPRNQDLFDSEILSQLQENFQNSAFEYIIRKAKVLAKGKGILCSPNPKPGKPLLAAVAVISEIDTDNSNYRSEDIQEIASEYADYDFFSCRRHDTEFFWCRRPNNSLSSGEDSIDRMLSSSILFHFILCVLKSGPVIKEKALEINAALGGNLDFVASDEWLTRWKKKHGIRSSEFVERHFILMLLVPDFRGRSPVFSYCPCLCLRKLILSSEALILFNTILLRFMHISERFSVSDRRTSEHSMRYSALFEKNTASLSFVSLAFAESPSSTTIQNNRFLLVDIMPHRTTINYDAYVATLKKLQARLSRVRRHWEKQDVLVLHDNAQPYVSHKTTDQIRKFG